MLNVDSYSRFIAHGARNSPRINCVYVNWMKGEWDFNFSFEVQESRNFFEENSKIAWFFLKTGVISMRMVQNSRLIKFDIFFSIRLITISFSSLGTVLNQNLFQNNSHVIKHVILRLFPYSTFMILNWRRLIYQLENSFKYFFIN